MRHLVTFIVLIAMGAVSNSNLSAQSFDLANRFTGAAGSGTQNADMLEMFPEVTNNGPPQASAAVEPPAVFKPTINITGFFQLDAGYYSQDAANQALLGDIDDGLGFRRTRLAAKGKVTEDTSYIIEFDIAQSQARFVDVWMQLDKTRFGNVRIGRFRQPFGMSELTSVRDLPFLERPSLSTENPFRQTGVMLFDASPDDCRTWAVSGYRFASDNFGNVFSDAGGYGLASRLTRIAAEWGPNQLWHLGVDYSFNTPKSGTVQLVNSNEFLIGQNPSFGPTGLSVLPFDGVPPFVNTGAIAADSGQLFNVESALAWGRMAIQAEARWASIDQTAGDTALFPAAYVQARYMLTGEEIPYDRSGAVFGRIKPHSPVSKGCGIGAWEAVGRISHLDLIDAGINGRRMTNYTTGLNWYLSEHTKFQWSWIHTQLDDAAFGESGADTLAARAQLQF